MIDDPEPLDACPVVGRSSLRPLHQREAEACRLTAEGKQVAQQMALSSEDDAQVLLDARER